MGMMASCSSSDDAVEGGGTTPEGGQNLYLSINVMSANEGTRAPQDGEDGGKYEYGTGAENTVDDATFYFFNADGSAANVVKQADGTFVNYFGSPTESTDGTTVNVEKLLNVTVVINPQKGDLIPDKIVAVINANALRESGDETSIPLSGKSLSELTATFGNYSLLNVKKFLMSSSVYSTASDGTGEKKLAVENIQGFFKETETAAKGNPIDIYVERVLAKVSVGANITTNNEVAVKDVDGRKLYYTGQTIDKSDGTDESKRIYVEFLGWNLTTETTNSYLFKNINPEWSDMELGITNWTWPNYFRSFWAVNPENVTYAENKNFTKTNAFAVGTVTDGYVDYATGEAPINYTYIQENANPYSANLAAAAQTKPTKIVVASQLVDKDGKVITLAEWKGVRSDTVGVKTSMANFSTIYYRKDDNTVAKITPDMLQFNYKAAAEGETKYTYVELTKEAGEKNTFYLTSAGKEAASVEDVNKALANLGKAKVYNDGRTYYYTDIRHFGKITTEDGKDVPSVGAYGVVRNHSYQVVLTSVTGLGTPVYDPDEVINPETPDEDKESYLAAQIKVLSWRVVKSTVDLQ